MTPQDAKHVCNCNSPGCRCQELVSFGGEICDMCKGEVHYYGERDDDYEIDKDHDFDVD